MFIEDLDINVTLTEREWKIVNECLKIAFDSGRLCVDCLQDVAMIGMDICDQVLNCLEGYHNVSEP